MDPAFPCRNVDAILNSIGEGVFTVDLDKRITSFNSAAEEITGFSQAEAVGSPCSTIFRTDICKTGCYLERSLKTGQSFSDVRALLTTKTGSLLPVRLTTAGLHDENGNLVGGIESFRDMSNIEILRKELYRRYTYQDIIGRSPPMQKLFSLIPRIAESTSTVVIEGETGTGKELFARAIHHLSPRKDGPFVAINCGALPDSLLESELFGHKAGAFTDAHRDKPGRFQRADGGTIFLDEISDISSAMQVRLLRVLQESVVEPLGSIKSVPVNVRVIVATNRPLKTMVEQGNFRDDLYYRIQVVHFVLPPLRRRKEDIPLLIDGIIAKFNHLQEKAITGVSDEALTRLMYHPYPGNIRELENIIEQAFVLCRGPMIEVHHLPPELQEYRPATTPGNTLESIERSAIEESLRRNNGHRRKAASELGIDPSTLFRKIRVLGIVLPDGDGRTGGVAAGGSPAGGSAE